MKLEDHMLPCISKQFLGIDCPGCGLQRAFIFILKGNFIEAFKMYPAIYTLLVFGFLIVYNFFFKNKVNPKIIYSLGLLNIFIIITNYILKLLF